MNRLGDWLGWIQLATALAVLVFLVYYYRQFVAGLIRFATTYLGLTAVLVVLYLMIYGLLGSGLGIPYLFWHDDFWTRASASTGATMLLAVIGVTAYYLDPYPWATHRRTANFLRADERIKHGIQNWYSRWLPIAASRADDPRWAGTRLRWWDYLMAGMNVFIDFVSITPLQSWLEPDRENALRLQRFLRAARGPFLLLLVAPALLPSVFTEVPRAAPTGKLGLEGLLHLEQPPTYDVSRHLVGYVIGLAAWLLGIQFGVLIIKFFIRSSTLLYGTRVSETARRLARVGEGPWQSQGIVWVKRACSQVGGFFGAGPPEDSDSWVTTNSECPNAEANACAKNGCPRGVPTGGHSCPQSCLAQGQLRAAAVVFAILFLLTYAVLGYIRYLREIGVLPKYPLFGLPLFDLPPAFAICAALAVLAMVYAAIAYLPRSWQIPVVLLLSAWFAYANNNPFNNQFENMSYGKDHLVRLRDRVVNAYDQDPKQRVEESDSQRIAPLHLKSDIDALKAWKACAADGDPDVDGGRPKLVLVAVSGGATRSAYWAAVVLDRLERTLGPSFGRRVRIISGASGGMLGAACYVTYRRAVAQGNSAERHGAREPGPGLEPPSLLPTWIRRDLPMRSMDPLARGIALTEIWTAAWPGTVREDRGVMLEKDWSVLRYPFAALAELEAQGKVPSLIFSPMIVEDGRRLLISNLELGFNSRGWAASPIVEAASPQINQDEPKENDDEDGTAHRRYSLSSLEFFRVFREKAHCGLFLSTAVRMSASFPYVSPAVNLPTDPPRRVVDAGYYDNYGIQVAISWLRRNRQWLARNTSGVLLVQIRDSSSVRDRLHVDDSTPGILGSASRGFQFLTSPIDAIARARYSTASFRNDADVAALNWNRMGFYDEPGTPDNPDSLASIFTTVIFENSAEVSLDPGDFWGELTKLNLGQPAKRDFREVSMSWYLARAEMAATAAAIPNDPPAPGPGEPDWRDGNERRRFMDKVNGDVSALPPGPDRALRLKRMDQLYNYERLLNLRKWWNFKAR